MGMGKGDRFCLGKFFADLFSNHWNTASTVARKAVAVAVCEGRTPTITLQLIGGS